jgi:hypothetical protein
MTFPGEWRGRRRYQPGKRIPVRSMSDEAGKEEDPVGMRQILGSSPHRSQEVPGVVQCHDDHNESTQYIYGRQARGSGGKKRRPRVDGGDYRRTRRCYHAPRFPMHVDKSFMAPS